MDSQTAAARGVWSLRKALVTGLILGALLGLITAAIMSGRS
jgi:hypothetical protein